MGEEVAPRCKTWATVTEPDPRYPRAGGEDPPRVNRVFGNLQTWLLSTHPRRVQATLAGFPRRDHLPLQPVPRNRMEAFQIILGLVTTHGQTHVLENV